MDGAAFLQLLKRGVPELQVQDFALPRQHVILHAEPLHGGQMAAHDRHGDDFRQFGRGAVALLDRRKRLAAQGRRPRFVFLEKLRYARVQVPAEVIEARRRGQRPNLLGGFPLQVLKATTTSATCTPVLSM